MVTKVRKSTPLSLARMRPTGMPPRPAIEIARAVNGCANSYCTHAGPPSAGAAIVSAVFRSSSQSGVASIAPAFVVACGCDWAMSLSSGGVRKAMTALSP